MFKTKKEKKFSITSLEKKQINHLPFFDLDVAKILGSCYNKIVLYRVGDRNALFGTRLRNENVRIITF